MKKIPQVTNRILASLCFLASLSSLAQLRPRRPDITTDEEIAKRVPWKDDCDVSNTPWNSFKMTVYQNDPSVIDRTLEISPLTRKAFADPKLRADDEKAIAEIKKSIRRIETTYERNSLGELFWDDQDEIKRLKALAARFERQEVLFNAPNSSLQGRDIVELLAAHNVNRNGRAKKGEELEGLRAEVQPGLGEVIESFPCETKNMRVCSVAFPRTENSLHVIDYLGVVVDDSNRPRTELKKLYLRTNRIKIDHCLRDYPMGNSDRETIRTACEVWPRASEDVDIAFRDVREQFIACRDALNAFLKTQSDIPRNERGKVVPKHN